MTKNPQNVLTRQVLLEKLWDADGNFVDEHALTAAISRVRNKIETEGRQYIKTCLLYTSQLGCHVLFTPIDVLLLRTIGIADGSLECGSFLCEDEFATMRRVRCLDPEGQGGGTSIRTCLLYTSIIRITADIADKL